MQTSPMLHPLRLRICGKRGHCYDTQQGQPGNDKTITTFVWIHCATLPALKKPED